LKERSTTKEFCHRQTAERAQCG